MCTETRTETHTNAHTQLDKRTNLQSEKQTEWRTGRPKNRLPLSVSGSAFFSSVGAKQKGFHLVLYLLDCYRLFYVDATTFTGNVKSIIDRYSFSSHLISSHLISSHLISSHFHIHLIKRMRQLLLDIWKIHYRKGISLPTLSTAFCQ